MISLLCQVVCVSENQLPRESLSASACTTKSFLPHKHVIIPDITELYLVCTFNPSQNELAFHVTKVSHWLKATGAIRMIYGYKYVLRKLLLGRVPMLETVSALCYGMLVLNLVFMFCFFFVWGCEIGVTKQRLLMWLSAQLEQLVCGRGKTDSTQQATAVILKHEPQLIGNHFRCTCSCSTTFSVYYQMSVLTLGN